MKPALRRTFVRPTSKGQVTLPVSVRRTLKIDHNTVLDVSIEGRRVVLSPVQVEDDQWETIIDFTEISHNGVAIEDVQELLRSWTKSKKHSKN